MTGKIEARCTLLTSGECSHEEDAAESDDEFGGMSKQTLDAKLEQLTIELAVAEEKEKLDPIRIAFRQFNKELKSLKGSLQYDGKAKELKMIRDYYNERYFEEEFTESLSVWQLKYMSDMFLAEIEKRESCRTRSTISRTTCARSSLRLRR